MAQERVWRVTRDLLKGVDKLQNLAVYDALPIKSPKSSLLVFFPGDIQNFSDEMKSQNPEFIEWSFEKTHEKLSKRFPSSHVLLITPARIESSFSEYDNLLGPGTGLLHLASLVNSFEEIAESYSNQLPIVLSGFSKGVLVLNNLISDLASLLSSLKMTDDPSKDSEKYPLFQWEFSGRQIPSCNSSPYLKDQEESKLIFEEGKTALSFFRRVKEIQYVDGHRFPTDPLVLNLFSEYLQKRSQEASPLRIYLHGSPRQIKDSSRPWIGEEFGTFERLLLRGKDQTTHNTPLLKKEELVVSQKHFWGERKSIHKHFEVINKFESPILQSLINKENL